VKAVFFPELKKLTVIEKDTPVIEKGEALVKIEYCGICGSDLHAYLEGTLSKVGSVMGHECSGVVVEVGESVEHTQIGDRVTIKPFPFCGNCHWCRMGESILCSMAESQCIGVRPEIDGAFAEYLRIEYPNKMLFKLPDNVSFEEGALVEPLATSFHGVGISRFKPGHRVAVIGAGPIGLGVVQFLKIGGAGIIIVLEISEKRAQTAKEIGADIVLNPIEEGQGLPGKVQELTDGLGADIVFEAAGIKSSIPTALRLIRGNGLVMVIGSGPRNVPLDQSMLVHKQAEIKGSMTYTDQDYQYVIDFMAKRKIKADLLISDVISLDDIEEKGFKKLLTSGDAVKILVKP
jgi:(R,R)-butanediol dehydrogenase/meso-butanediol dehydrogenase/diacetyl reductase